DCGTCFAPLGCRVTTPGTLSGEATGSGLKSSAWAMARSVVLKPMPIAREATATRVKAGLLRNHLRAKRMSARRDSSKTHDYNSRMTRLTHATFAICTLVLLSASMGNVIETTLVAQNGAPSSSFTLEQVLDYPFPDNLVAAPKHNVIAWTLNERGARNIYTAEAPDFTARRLTPYSNDDGQELTNLSVSSDGRTIVYVRGGDHGSNWPAEGNLMPNPSSSATQPKMQVWLSALGANAQPKLVGE